ncbi:transposase InsO family protein [Variovorax sp. GrIS 2.14]|uniref:hypothetical protein n=1 Tax=Variovorax sp. GrIS 2.14 TaxID=3071709 RepID=UPI0038F6876A
MGEISPAPEDLVNRDFTAAAPNEKWLTDISEFQILTGGIPSVGVNSSILKIVHDPSQACRIDCSGRSVNQKTAAL